MSVRVAINGFGRIGRNILRAIVEADRHDIEVIAINDLAPVETNAHLLRFDSIHGRFPGEVTVKGDTISCRQRRHQSHRDEGPGATAVARTRHRRGAGMHRHLHLEGQGLGASDGRRQARPDLGAGRRCRSHRGLWRQSRQAQQIPHRGLQRLLHHQLPGAGRQGAQRRRRHRQGFYDHDPLLHQRPAVARSGAQGSFTGRAPRRST